MAERCYLGVDVGTGSVRAAVFDGSGRALGMGTEPTRIWRPEKDYVQQSSSDIWSSAAAAVRGALQQARIGPGTSPASASTPPARWSCWTRQTVRSV
jgi:D-ribulokinase